MTTTAGKSPTRVRQDWMDLVRGGAVLLVAVFHASPVLRSVGLSPTHWMGEFNAAFAPFRIPALVLLSGSLLGVALAKSPWAYAWGKVRRIGWPYAVWLAVFAAVTWPAPLAHRSFLLGGTYLWFLAFLLVFYATALVVRRVPTTVVIAVALLCSVLAADGSKYGERLFFLLAVFMTGHLLTEVGVLDTRWVDDLRIAGPAAVVAAVGLYLGTDQYGPASVLVTAAGLVVVVWASRRLQGRRVTRPLAFTGRHSLVVYVSHYPVMLLTARLVQSSSDAGAVVTWAVAITVAVAVGTALAATSDRRPIRWLFEAPFGAPRPPAWAGGGPTPQR